MAKEAALVLGKALVPAHTLALGAEAAAMERASPPELVWEGRKLLSSSWLPCEYA